MAMTKSDVKALLEFKECRAHHIYSPDEEEVRPLAEYRVNKEGKIHPVYCKRCTAKKAAEYQKRRRAEMDPDSPLMKRNLLDGLLKQFRQTILDLAAQIDTGDDAQLRKLSKIFGATAAEAVLPLPQHVAEARQSLPPTVHDQRNVEVP
jgi:hypothetical protein